MTAVSYCRCRHARQIHLTFADLRCRGRCTSSPRAHTLADHTGWCTARCDCERFSERQR